MKTRYLWMTMTLVTALAVGCSPSEEPVAQLEVTPAESTLAYPGWSDLELSWTFERPLAGVEGKVRVFVHLIDDLGGLARTFDHDLPVAWAPGSTASYDIELYQSALAPPLAEGSYDLVAGVYDAAGNSWPVVGAGAAEAGNRVGRVRVSEAGEGFPMFYFSESWQPVESGSDRQILGRRWGGQKSTLQVAEIASPGSVWLLVGIPQGATDVEDLVKEDGEAELAVRVTSTCGGFDVTLAGAGTQELEFPIAADAEGALPEACDLVFDANFYLISLDTMVRRTVALENLSWRPAS